MSEQYCVNCTCTNCGNKQQETIEKGTQIDTHLRYVVCKQCGCRTLRKTIGL